MNISDKINYVEFRALNTKVSHAVVDCLKYD